MEQVILVDTHDHAIGTMEKMEAHRQGVLHRAFSVVVYNSSGKILLQKRAKSKYHSGGLWTNACCSHPQPGELMEDAINRKLKQELGIELKTELAYKFIYRTTLENNLIEHELDHVYVGIYDGEPAVNPQEVESWKFISMDELQNDRAINPDHYTYWFKLMLDSKQLYLKAN